MHKYIHLIIYTCYIYKHLPISIYPGPRKYRCTSLVPVMPGFVGMAAFMIQGPSTTYIVLT